MRDNIIRSLLEGNITKWQNENMTTCLWGTFGRHDVITPCHYVMLSWRHSVMRSRCYHDVMLSCCHDCKSTFAPKARARLVIISVTVNFSNFSNFSGNEVFFPMVFNQLKNGFLWNSNFWKLNFYEIQILKR